MWQFFIYRWRSTVVEQLCEHSLYIIEEVHSRCDKYYTECKHILGRYNDSIVFDIFSFLSSFVQVNRYFRNGPADRGWFILFVSQPIRSKRTQATGITDWAVVNRDEYHLPYKRSFVGRLNTETPVVTRRKCANAPRLMSLRVYKSLSPKLMPSAT